MNRRLDIQGLRAIAVLVVVAFHAKLNVPGGFTGVDVFFVISGFVITSMLHREWISTGSIRFRSFYLRRFKRLTPALAAMVGVTMILSTLLLSPLGPQQTAAKTGLGAMFLSANFVIAQTTAGYFDAPAENNPLLNTWSLSVEELFYLGFPFILAIGWILARKTKVIFFPLVIVGAIGCGSFVLAALGSKGKTFKGSETLLGFYSPFSRSWEFAVGALLALVFPILRMSSSRFASVAGLLGLFGLGASMWIISGSTPFPGPWTLLPVAATALLLLAGRNEQNIVSKTLSLKPLVKIGDWSYAIYLWHWPLIVFSRVLWPQTRHIEVYAAIVSIAPALMSYQWVERPIRRLRPMSRPQLATLVTAIVIPPILLAGAVGSAAGQVWAPRYKSGSALVVHEGDIGHTEFHSFIRSHYYPCTPQDIRGSALKWEGILRCQQSKSTADVDFALVGDSHAEHLFLGLAEAMPNRNIVYYIVDGLPIESSPEMNRILEYIVASKTIKTVIVNGYWSARGVPIEALSNTLSRFVQSGKKTYVTDDVPNFPFDPFTCKFRKTPVIADTQCTIKFEAWERQYQSYYGDLLAVLQKNKQVEMLNTAHYFCNDIECDMSANDKVLYRDPNHLNMNGSRLLARRLLNDYTSLRGVSEKP